MLDAVDLILPETKAAFIAVDESQTGRFFNEDLMTLAVECTKFFAAPHEWLPSTYGELLDGHVLRGQLLGEQVFLVAWAKELSQEAAQEFAGIIGYLAGLAVVEVHLAVQNPDRDFVELASAMLEDSFSGRFAELVAAGALESSRIVN